MDWEDKKSSLVIGAFVKKVGNAIFMSKSGIMKSALFLLARQVYQFMQPSELIQETEAATRARKAALDMAAHLEIDFLEQYGQTAKPKAQRALIHATQLGSVHLADQLENYISMVRQYPLPPDVKENCTGYYRSLQEPLLGLLRFLQLHFQQDWNADQKIPDCQLPQVKAFFRNAVDIVTGYSATETPLQCIQVLTGLLNDQLLDETTRVIRYGSYAYWQKITTALLAKEKRELSSCIEILVLYNCNHHTLVHALMNDCRKEVRQLTTLPEQRMQWEEYLQLIKGIHPLPAHALVAGGIGCRQLLQEMIQEEIKQELAGEEPNDMQEGSFLQPKPFQTNLSVSQLAGMVRLLVEADILCCTNQTVLLSNISRNFTTRRQQHISAESLRQKYYQPDSATVSMLKTHLMNMMRRLK